MGIAGGAGGPAAARVEPGAPLGFDQLGFDQVVEAQALQIPRFQAWVFKHDIVEACTAVKGQMLVECLAAGFDIVIYLDPDIALFSPLRDILRRLEDASIVLTPHQAEPNDSQLAVDDNERTSLRYGIYNLGFLAVRNDPTGRAFADWWSSQLHRACYDAVDEGLFTDQKYCDLAPALFDRVHIERDPGCNVASWNLSRRALRFEGGDLLVNGSPLKFYHFTKIGGVGDTMTERYGGEATAVIEVWTWYKRQLAAANAMSGLPQHDWHYGRFANGEPISKPARVLYRSREDLMAYFDDPFAAGEAGFHSWLQEEAPELLTA